MGIALDCWRKLSNPLSIALFLSVLACVGCRSPGHSRIINEREPLDEATRSSFGRVGLLLPNDSPAFDLRYPDNTQRAMVKTAARTWDTVYSDDADLEDLLAEVVMSSMISGVSGVLGGLISGVSQKKIDAVEQQLSSVVRENPPLSGISNHLQFALQRRGRAPIAIPAAVAAALSESTSTNRDYTALVAVGIDTLIEIRLLHYGFQGEEERINPPMIVEAVAHLDITRASDGHSLFSGPIHYRGHQHRFTEWASEDAKKFRSELRRAEWVIARNIIEQLLPPMRAGQN